MYTSINEHISTGVIFSSGRIIPRFFVWKKKKYQIEKVTYRWRSKIGSVPVLHFSVKCQASVYELSYNLKTSDWCLEKVYVE